MAKTASKVVVVWLRITPNTPFFLQFEAIFALFLCQKPCLQNPFCCPFSFSFSFFDSFFFAMLGVLGLLVVIVLVLVFLFFFFFFFFSLSLPFPSFICSLLSLFFANPFQVASLHLGFKFVYFGYSLFVVVVESFCCSCV